MKIIYISSSTIPSRTANSVHVMKMCHAFVQNGHDVTLLAPDKLKEYDNLKFNWYTYYGVSDIFQIKKLPWLYSIKGKALIYGFLAAMYACLKRPDLIYCRNIFAAYFISWVGIKFIFESHAPVSDSSKLESKLFERIAYSQSLKKIVVITDSLKQYYIKKYPDLKERLKVAPDGADLIELDKIKDKARGYGERVKVGYTGHLYVGKGMEVISRLAKICPWADFSVVGGTKEDINFWKNQAPSKNIIFHGYVPHSEVWRYLLDLDVVLLPNQKKVLANGIGEQDIGQWTSPLKAFEYMAAKKPIIASDLPVLREILINGYNALLCPPNDIPAWEAALLRLVQDKSFADQLALTAHDRFLKNYTWEARAKKLLVGLL